MEAIALCTESPDDSFGVWSSPHLQQLIELPPVDGAESSSLPLMCLDAAILGDIPARYTIASVPEHAFPAVGVYLDRRIVPGFRYRVKVLPYQEATEADCGYYLFHGAALRLDAIGRGYSRRLTFQPDSTSSLNENENFLWTDSHPGGVALELSVVDVGDSFHVVSALGVLLGRCDVISVKGPQEEISQVLSADFVLKKVQVQLDCQIRWLNYSEERFVQKVTGIVECVKKKGGGHVEITKVLLDQEGANGNSLVPCKRGYETSFKVGSPAGGGLPTIYTVEGLLDSEFPIIGTYVDPRIVPGFKYVVRRLGSKSPLFGGRALTLLSVGIGYGKRISFEPDEGCLNDPHNYFWSDSAPHGFALQPVAVEKGTRLKLVLDDVDEIREVQVVHIASRQRETSKRLTTSSVEAVFEVDLVCRWSPLSEASHDSGDLVRFTGSAELSRPHRSKTASLTSIRELKFLRTPNFSKGTGRCQFILA